MDPTAPFHRMLAAAYVRGSGKRLDLNVRLMTAPLGSLAEADLARIVSAGREGGLRLQRFKRTMGLPRVDRVLGILRGLGASSLLDVGSGRGTSLWPILDTFPTLPVTAIDALPHRAEAIEAVRRGGIASLRGLRMDATDLSAFPDRSFDVVTALEVLEHIPEVARAIREIVRVAGRFVVLSVPSKPDDNPEHLHLLDRKALDGFFRAAGARNISFDGVPNHLVAVASVS